MLRGWWYDEAIFLTISVSTVHGMLTFELLHVKLCFDLKVDVLLVVLYIRFEKFQEAFMLVNTMMSCHSSQKCLRIWQVSLRSINLENVTLNWDSYKNKYLHKQILCRKIANSDKFALCVKSWSSCYFSRSMARIDIISIVHVV